VGASSTCDSSYTRPAEKSAISFADLGERRLANVGGLSGTVTGPSMWDALGNQLLDFVTYLVPDEV